MKQNSWSFYKLLKVRNKIPASWPYISSVVVKATNKLMRICNQICDHIAHKTLSKQQINGNILSYCGQIDRYLNRSKRKCYDIHFCGQWGQGESVCSSSFNQEMSLSTKRSVILLISFHFHSHVESQVHAGAKSERSVHCERID